MPPDTIVQLIQDMHQGMPQVLRHLAAHLCEEFHAGGAGVELDGATAQVGQNAPRCLEYPIERGATVVGRIWLGAPRGGDYSPDTTTRLADYARLAEALGSAVRERDQWRELAWTDDLSGLRNRRYFETTLDNLVRQAERHPHTLLVLLFDIDDFKTYNDLHGHGTGDELIRELGLLLTRSSRETDLVARYGGDEFGVIMWDPGQPRLPGSRPPDDPTQLAERFCRTIHRHKFVCLGEHAPGPVTISGGLAAYPQHGRSAAELLRAADAALLEAKRSGKNRIRLACV